MEGIRCYLVRPESDFRLNAHLTNGRFSTHDEQAPSSEFLSDGKIRHVEDHDVNLTVVARDQMAVAVLMDHIIAVHYATGANGAGHWVNHAMARMSGHHRTMKG